MKPSNQIDTAPLTLNKNQLKTEVTELFNEWKACWQTPTTPPYTGPDIHIGEDPHQYTSIEDESLNFIKLNLYLTTVLHLASCAPDGTVYFTLNNLEKIIKELLADLPEKSDILVHIYRQALNISFQHIAQTPEQNISQIIEKQRHLFPDYGFGFMENETLITT